MTGDDVKAVRCWCNSCSRETDHAVTDRHNKDFKKHDDGATTDVISVIVRCRGCGEVSIRDEVWHSAAPEDDEDDDEFPGDRELVELVEVSYRPPRLWARPPDWLRQLEQIEPDLKDILGELYLATNDSQVRLLAMGVRTALDYVMTRIVGDVGTFPDKLRAMVAAGHLTAKQSEMLDTVIDAGSAAAHRGFKPNKELLREMVITMETVIRDHYLTGPMLKAMKQTLPPRPTRPPRRK